jgi:hypothetical protein
VRREPSAGPRRLLVLSFLYGTWLFGGLMRERATGRITGRGPRRRNQVMASAMGLLAVAALRGHRLRSPGRHPAGLPGP